MNLVCDEEIDETRPVIVTNIFKIGAEGITSKQYIYRIITEQKQYLKKLVKQAKMLADGGIETFEIRRAFSCDHEVAGAHYECAACNKVYPCPVCHDNAEAHHYELGQMVCVFCKHLEDLQLQCQKCGEVLGSEMCTECPFITAIDKEFLQFYHCKKCAKCIIGTSLVHCDTCNKCYTQKAFKEHKCGVVYDGNCPICMDALTKYTSRTLFCGHEIHIFCFANVGKSICPVCEKIALTGSKREEYLESERTKEELFATNIRHCLAYCRECERKFNTEFSDNLGIFCKKCRTFNCEVIGEADGVVEEWALRNGDDNNELEVFIIENFLPEDSHKLTSQNFADASIRRQIIEIVNAYILEELK